MNRECKKCGNKKPLEEFSVRSDNGAYRYECLECTSKFMRAYRKENKVHQRYLAAVINYGITYEEAVELYSRTNCEICTNKFKTVGCIDHDHKTGAIRGVICHKCNRGIGYLNDSIEILKSALAYLIKHK